MKKWLELAHETRGHIFPTALYWIAAQRACSNFGVKGGSIACWYTNHEFSYLVQERAFTEAGKRMIVALEKNNDLIEKIEQVNRKEVPLMLESAKSFSNHHLSSKSGEELYILWQDWLNIFLSMMEWSVIGTVLEMEEPLLSNAVTQILEQRLKDNKDMIAPYFHALTTSERITTAQKEELDLLSLRIKDATRKLSEKNLSTHVKEYSWVAFGYDGPGWTKEDIRKRLNLLPKKREKLELLLKEKKEFHTRLKRKQEEIKNSLKLDDRESRLFLTLRTLGFWKFERKLMNQRAHEMLENLFVEIANRNNLSTEEAKMIPPSEMKQVLIEKEVDTDLLKGRLKESVFLFEGISYEVLSGKKVSGVSRRIQADLSVNQNIQRVEGITAYPGKAKGVVKIIDRPQEMNKMEMSNILVSASTSPQIVQAMKKASAIVTNSGGITCHAAIVARELKTPCVIGTKIATKLFKDGDKIEVDANNGVVKKI